MTTLRRRGCSACSVCASSYCKCSCSVRPVERYGYIRVFRLNLPFGLTSPKGTRLFVGPHWMFCFLFSLLTCGFARGFYYLVLVRNEL